MSQHEPGVEFQPFALTGTYSRHELYAAGYVPARQTWIGLGLILALLLCAAFSQMYLLAAWGTPDTPTLVALVGPAISVVLTVVGLVLGARFVNNRAFQQRLAREPELLESFKIEFGEADVLFRRGNKVSRTGWRDVTAWNETRTALTFSARGQAPVLVPKRLFTDDSQLLGLRQKLVASGAPNAAADLGRIRLGIAIVLVIVAVVIAIIEFMRP